KHAAELVALAPDVIVTDTSFDVAAVQQVTRTVPIVFGGVIDPVGNGLIDNLARPGGNTTGFTAFEYAIGAKWLELLKEVAPRVTRAVVLRDPTIAAGIGQFAAIQATAPFGIEVSAVGLHDAAAIEPAVAAFARDANGGLVMTAGPFGANHPDVIPMLAARYKLPAVYPWRYFINAGGLMAYGSDLASQFRSAAQYVDRILRGEKPANLPVQAPTKYELVSPLLAQSGHRGMYAVCLLSGVKWTTALRFSVFDPNAVRSRRLQRPLLLCSAAFHRVRNRPLE